MKTFAYMSFFLFLAISGPLKAQDEYFFSDTFESGTLTDEDHSSFKWSGYNSSGVVTSIPTPQVLSGTGIGTNVAGKDWKARLGNNALRVVYPAGKFWAEQHFDLGQGLQEVWFKFDLRVPTNFTHENQGPGIPSNSKLFYVWMDDYSYKGKGATVGWEYWKGSDGISALAVNIQSDNANRHTGHQHHFDFINSKTDKGKWMSLVFHLKTSSKDGAADGVVSLYRKWDDEDEFVRYHHVTNAILPPQFGGFRQGYLMGWHNGHYAQDTEWLIDNFIVSSENILERRPVMPVKK